MAAEAWPNIRWTALTFAPSATARLAAVCRNSCGVSPLGPTTCGVNWRSAFLRILAAVIAAGRGRLRRKRTGGWAGGSADIPWWDESCRDHRKPGGLAAQGERGDIRHRRG